MKNRLTRKGLTMNKVRYEEMLPHEVVAARKANPIAYLPIGTVEWHGLQNALGLAPLKARSLCERAAAQGGASWKMEAFCARIAVDW